MGRLLSDQFLFLFLFMNTRKIIQEIQITYEGPMVMIIVYLSVGLW